MAVAALCLFSTVVFLGLIRCLRAVLQECPPRRSATVRRTFSVAACAFVALAVCTPPEMARALESDAGSPSLTAYFFDVGQADSEFVVFPDGATMLIDAGTADAAHDIVETVRWLGYDRIDYLVATHPHADHIAGMPEVLEQFDVGMVIAPEVAHNTHTFEDFLDAVAAEGLSITPAEAGLVVHEGEGFRAEVLSPEAGVRYDDLNDWSAVLKLSYGSTSMLFTGDASAWVLEGLDVGHVDVLKVAHHGSDTGTTPALLGQLSPSTAVIEVGAGNTYGHPTQETLGELAAAGTRVWRTDQDGSVYAVSDGACVWTASTSGALLPVGETAGEVAPDGTAGCDASSQAGGDPGSVVVYTTETGDKYHVDGCPSLRKSKVAISLSDAVAQGYGACKRCAPPEL